MRVARCNTPGMRPPHPLSMCQTQVQARERCCLRSPPPASPPPAAPPARAHPRSRPNVVREPNMLPMAVKMATKNRMLQQQDKGNRSCEARQVDKRGQAGGGPQRRRNEPWCKPQRRTTRQQKRLTRSHLVSPHSSCSFRCKARPAPGRSAASAPASRSAEPRRQREAGGSLGN